jgi:eukaryotic-like serine/threonine-protein kinase
MGSVYEAEPEGGPERVAVKVLHAHLLEPGGVGPRRFRREVETARAIRSEHVVRMLDAGEDDATGHIYLVTEYLEGEDLQRLLERIGPLAVEGALRVMHQVLSGLCDAHDAGVIHRDIKPANIFLARGEGGKVKVKLLDFGIAKMRPDSMSPAVSADLTTTGGFLGSPLYMSPEQVQSSRDVDHRTDLWSAGCAFYAMLTGRAPHQHLSAIGQLLVAICVTPAPPLSEIAPWVPRHVAEAVHRALHLHRDERYSSAARMLEAIRSMVPDPALSDDVLVPSGESPRAASLSTGPVSSSPRVIVAPGSNSPIRGDESTQVSGREVARSGVPVVGMGAKAGARVVTVDPRRILGETSELWTFSLDVHKSLSSLLSRIWKAMRRSGAKVPPLSYGAAWVLFEPRTGRVIEGQGASETTLDQAGIRPGTILWVVPPDAVPRRDSVS